ncbi:alpha/beta hydrolase [Maioricimonas sp. JC845]|uniref:alpha/beta hydrolase n=1 Tax=Maioricimonas sp. JC845 TaxID=3232138 RepID=UPI00345861BD
MSMLIPPVLPVRIAMLLVVTAGSLLAQPPETGQRRQRGERRGGQRTRTEVPPVLDEEFIRTRLPAGVRYISDIVYRNVDGSELKLDLFLPDADSTSGLPLAVWIHGGAWMRGNKARDFHRYDQLAARILEDGFALASIEYRLSGTATFPAQIEDCTAALGFLHRNRKKYGLDTGRVVVMGTSAGGHLASLVGTGAAARLVPDSERTQQEWTIRGVVNFYGPSDLILLQGKRDDINYDEDRSPEARLLGHSPLIRPDLAKAASPTTYVSRTSPPFLIFHGDADTRVPITQSVLLDAWLRVHGVQSRLVVVEGARHGDQMFDDMQYVEQVSEFVRSVTE